MKYKYIRDRYKDVSYELGVTEYGVEGDVRFSHTLYLLLLEEMHPDFKLPEISSYHWGKIFNYNDYGLSELNWHGGVTFLEAKKLILYPFTEIKIGCDYAHYRDDMYMERECLDWIKGDAEKLIDELLIKYPDINLNIVNEYVKELKTNKEVENAGSLE